MKLYEGVANPQTGHPSDINASGRFSRFTVLVNGDPLPLEPSLKIRNHSPDGFAWGYAGSGPAQLSLALLLDALGSKQRAQRLYQKFKFKVVAHWPQDQGWSITQSEIRRICAEIERDH